jgi:hypothetical protein
MRNQLQRRPPSAVWLIVSMSGYTSAAQVLTRYLGSQTILLWHPNEIAAAVQEHRIVGRLAAKHHACVELGAYDANTINLEVV